MKKFLRDTRRVAAIGAEINNVLVEAVKALALVVAVVAFGLWTWWYPIDYLAEGATFHESRLTQLIRNAGYTSIRNVTIKLPRDRFENFKTTCRIWVQRTDGDSFRPIEFSYQYMREGWLEGAVSIIPSTGALQDERLVELEKYLDWSGVTREALLNCYDENNRLITSVVKSTATEY